MQRRATSTVVYDRPQIYEVGRLPRNSIRKLALRYLGRSDLLFSNLSSCGKFQIFQLIFNPPFSSKPRETSFEAFSECFLFLCSCRLDHCQDGIWRLPLQHDRRWDDGRSGGDAVFGPGLRRTKNIHSNIPAEKEVKRR